MYKKIYISVDDLEKEDEIKKFHFLFDELDSKVIWSYSMKMWEGYEWKIFDVWVLELFLFYSYLRNKWYKKNQIEILSNKPLFIINDDLYKIELWKCIKMDTKNVWFFTVRAINWNNPFFFLLKKVIEKKWWKVDRTNNSNLEVYWKWKLFALNSLYNKRKKYIWDIIVPYKLQKTDYLIFRDFIKNNFSSKIVIKRDFSCAWKWVYVVDLENYDDKQNQKFENWLKNMDIHYKANYITPYYDFFEEYRFYFTKYNNKIKIHSFKKKKVMSSFEDIKNADTFQYYKNVKITWEYVSLDNWCNYEEILKLAKKYIKKLEYGTGTLEFWKTIDWKIIFFEVNPMSATVCYSGEDENNMNKYYNKIFADLL